MIEEHIESLDPELVRAFMQTFDLSIQSPAYQTVYLRSDDNPEFDFGEPDVSDYVYSLTVFYEWDEVLVIDDPGALEFELYPYIKWWGENGRPVPGDIRWGDGF